MLLSVLLLYFGDSKLVRQHRHLRGHARHARCTCSLQRWRVSNNSLQACPITSYSIAPSIFLLYIADLVLSNRYKHADSYFGPSLQFLHIGPTQHLMSYTNIHNLILSTDTPSSMSSMLSQHTEGRTLRSGSDAIRLRVPRTVNDYGGLNRSCCVPTLWNGLPSHTRGLNSPTAFKSTLQTHLFGVYY